VWFLSLVLCGCASSVVVVSSCCVLWSFAPWCCQGFVLASLKFTGGSGRCLVSFEAALNVIFFDSFLWNVGAPLTQGVDLCASSFWCGGCRSLIRCSACVPFRGRRVRRVLCFGRHRSGGL